MTCRLLLLTLLLAAAAASRAGAGTLTLARPLGDGMVIQRGAAVPVIGSAAPHAKVTVTFAGARVRVRADAAGRFVATLSPLPAGGPHELMVAAGGETLVVRDVLVGDVWVCSGQSNMEWVVADSLDAAHEIDAAGDARIRHFKVPHGWSAAPLEEVAGGPWERADPQHVGAFSAVGYYFARELRKAVDVPIGLLNASWGGSRIEPWMSAASLGLDDAGLREVLARESEYGEKVLAGIRARVGELPQRDGGLVDGRAVWADPTLDDAAWGRMSVPGRWEDAGFEGMDGIVWFRTTLELTAEEAAGAATLSLGAIDDSDVAWVNGSEVGRTDLAWNTPRAYPVPAGTLRAGRNVVAVRVEDTGGGGGMWGAPAQLYLDAAGRRRPLSGEWRFRIGTATVNLDFHKNQVPVVLQNAMVRPLQRYPVAGVLWYQGESNADPADAYVYRDRFRALIADWRAGWRRADLPFLWVQLAAFMASAPEPRDSSWALLRESQSAALALPRTAQAVAIDVGDADDIHPRNKQEVGRRLALAARAVTYGGKLEWSGPTYLRHALRGGRVVIEFDHAAGLAASGGPGARPRGFAIAGVDRRFVWADAAVEEGRVVVWSESVPAPVAVRYAWADNPQGANLCNGEGLPAAPFRTDAW